MISQLLHAWECKRQASSIGKEKKKPVWINKQEQTQENNQSLIDEGTCHYVGGEEEEDKGA